MNATFHFHHRAVKMKIYLGYRAHLMCSRVGHSVLFTDKYIDRKDAVRHLREELSSGEYHFQTWPLESKYIKVTRVVAHVEEE